MTILHENNLVTQPHTRIAQLTKVSELLAMAKRGLHIFPVKPKSKIPYGKDHKCACKVSHKNGHLDATIDEATITDWKQNHANCNWAMHCKWSRIVVADPDKHPGKPNGVANFKKLIPKEDYANTVIVRTGTGFHIWYRAPEGVQFNGILCEEVQIKHDGYVLLPGSVHPETKEIYEWYKGKSIFTTEIADLPDSIRRIAVKATSKNIKAKDSVPDTNDEPGTISDKDYKILARRLQSKSMPPSNAEQVIANCAAIRHCVEDAETLSEPEWYSGIIGGLGFCENGEDIVHKYSAPYPKYDPRDTQAKFEHWKDEGRGPTTCAKLQEVCGEKYCNNCPFKDKIKAPITLGHVTKKLEDNKQKPPQFPTDAFPVPFANYANAAAKSLRCPVDYCFVLILALTAILIGNLVGIKITTDFIRYASIWIAIVGRPGDKKSPALEICVTRPIKIILDKLKDKFDFTQKVYESEMQDYKNALKTWDKNSGSPAPVEPVKPFLKQVITSDTTVEALAEILEKNPPGVGIICDELSGFLRSHNQYKGGQGADRSHYLAMRNNAPMVINRKGKDSIYVPKPYAPIAGCLQPDVVSEIKSTQRGMIDDGYLERFDFSCPERCNDPPGMDVPIPEKIKNKFIKLVETLFQSRNLGDRMLVLSEEAHKEFIKAELEWHQIVNSPDFDPYLETFYSKMPGKLGEYALIINEMKRATGGVDSDVVEVSVVQAAKKIADYFLAHAQIALGIISKTLEERKAEQAFKWIQTKGLVIVQARDLITYKVTGVKKKTDAIVLMKSLADFGYGHLDLETNNLIFPRAVCKSAKPNRSSQLEG